MLEGTAEVWTSPLRRARITASLALPHLVARVNHAFIEVDYGSLDGEPLSSVSHEQWYKFETDHTTAIGGGESSRRSTFACTPSSTRLLGDPASLLHDDLRHLVIVSHVSPIKSALAWALGVPGSVAWRARLDNGSLTTIGTRRGTPRSCSFNVVPRLGA